MKGFVKICKWFKNKWLYKGFKLFHLETLLQNCSMKIKITKNHLFNTKHKMFLE